MERRIAREYRPVVEPCERRELLSGITDVMAANGIAASMRAIAEAAANARSIPSVAIPQNQGPLLNPDGSVNNAALAPTGNVTQFQFRKQKFKAHFVGTYTEGAGPTTDESKQVFITGGKHEPDVARRHSDAAGHAQQSKLTDRRGHDDL